MAKMVTVYYTENGAVKFSRMTEAEADVFEAELAEKGAGQ